MKRLAFTMLELVFVIIVIGILAVLAMPNFRGNPLQTAAEQVASHIRYTQHLAMVDDKFDENNATWFEGRWQIHFEDGMYGEKVYIIYNNLDSDVNEDDDEIARDPSTGRLLKGFDNDIASDPLKYSENLMISKTYGITNVTFNADCHPSSPTSSRIGFDSMGRPYYYSSGTSPYTELLTEQCNITLVHSDGNATISVHPETGYVEVNYTN